MKQFPISGTGWIAQSPVVFQCNLILFKLTADRDGQETSCLDDCAVWRFIATPEFGNGFMMLRFYLGWGL